MSRRDALPRETRNALARLFGTRWRLQRHLVAVSSLRDEIEMATGCVADALNKIERHEYVILFRHKMGLNRFGAAASAPAAQSPSSAGASAAAAAKEKTAFDVKLEKFEASAKLKVIKEIRSFTDLGLKEAKDLVEKTPAVVKKGVTKEEAEKIVAKLKEIGATVVLE